MVAAGLQGQRALTSCEGAMGCDMLPAGRRGSVARRERLSGASTLG